VPRRRWQALLPALLLASAALVAYWPALHGDFLWDDDTLVTASDLVKADDGLRRMWFTTEPLDYWPVTNTSFWIEWRLWGMRSSGYHVTNLLLHVCSGILIWAILQRLSVPGALFAAFLFVLHPVNVESVAWIAQRKNTLSMVFFLLSILWYVKQIDRPLLGMWYWLSLAAFVVAMLSKGSVVILPLVLLLLAWWQHGRIARADLFRVAPFFAFALLLTAVNIWFQLHLTTGPIRDVTALQRLLGASAVVWFYLSKALVPVRLIFIYPQWDVRADDLRWWLLLAAAVAATAVLVAFRARPIARALLGAWLFFAIALVPVMGFADVYYMTYSLVADHYQYIAIVGVCAVAAAGLTVLVKGARARAALSGAVLLLFGIATWRQCEQYVNAETLYRATLDGNPTCWLAHNLLGVQLVEHSPEEAVSHFRDAARLKPDNVEALNNLCLASRRVGRLDDTVRACTEALRLNPTLAMARSTLDEALAFRAQVDPARVAAAKGALAQHPDQVDLHIELADALLDAGRPDEALAEYRSVLKANPDAPAVQNGLGMALADLGRADEAEPHFREAIRLAPRLPEPHRHLADLLQERGALQDAVAEYLDALKYDPRSAEAHNNLGVVFGRIGKLDEAIAHFKAALAIQPDDADARANLARTLARAGKSP